MKQFELQKPISQLLNVLKCHLLACELISDRNVLNNLIKPIISEKIILVLSSFWNYIVSLYCSTCFSFQLQVLGG